MSIRRRLPRLSTLFLWIVGAAFLLGYAARYVPPRVFWWPELFAIVLPYSSAAILVLFTVVLFQRRRRAAATCGILLVFTAVRFLPGHDLSWTQSAGADDLVVMTLNLPGPNRVGLAPSLQAEHLRTLVERAQPHIGAFQEAIHLRRNPDIGPDLCYSWRAEDGRFCFLYSTPQPQTFDPRQVVVSRIPAEVQDYVSLEHSEPGVHANQFTRVRFTWQGREAVLYVVHLQSYHPPDRVPSDLTRPTPLAWIDRILASRSAFIARAEEAEQIATLIEQETLPVIVAGDFNSTAHNWAYYRIARSLTDSYRAAGTGWGATWHEAFPFARIDFVLASDEWDVVAARVATTSLSDHLPVLVRLRLRSKTP